MPGRSKKVTVGYKYFMGLHFALCYGPVDALRRLIVGDRQALAANITNNTTVAVNQPSLFGGDEREGGIVGDLQVLMGAPTQTLTDKILAALGSGSPAFRGVLSAFYDGQIGANNPYVKPFAFQVTRVLQGWNGGTAWEPGTAPIYLSGDLPALSAEIISVGSGGIGGGGTFDTVDVEQTYDLLHSNVGITNTSPVVLGRWSFGKLNPSNARTVTCRAFVNDVARFDELFDYPAGQEFLQVAVQLNQLQPGDVLRLEATFSSAITLTTLTMLWRLVPNAGGPYTPLNPEKLIVVAAEPDFGLLTSATGAFTHVRAVDSLIDYWGVQTLSESTAFFSMNPAHIIYQCLTDPNWGMGYPTLSIGPTFVAAADTLFDEDFGLCMVWNQQEELGTFIGQVLNHCGGILSTDPSTGLFELTLLRGDYDPDDLPVFNPDTIVDLESFQRVGYGDTVNEITVVFRDWQTNKDTPVTVQDLANVQAQAGVVSQTRQYPGLPTFELASRVAQRDLVAASTPLAKGRMSVNRNAWSLIPGGVFKLTWPKLGLTGVICRVLAVDYGDLRSGLITIDFAEDVFGLPASSYAAQEPAGWSEPDTTPAVIVDQTVVEVPYWTLSREMSAADLSFVDMDAAYLAPLAAKPTSTSQNYRIWSRVGAVDFEDQNIAEFVPAAVLAADIDAEATTITLSSTVDLDLVEPETLAIVGTGQSAEWMKVVSIDTAVPSIVVSRAMLDTTPRAHLAGATVFFTDTANSEEETERATGETVDFRLATIATGGELDYTLATTVSGTAEQRQYRPYPPGNVKINGIEFPAIIIVGTFTVTWAHRDRLQQTAFLVDQSDGSIGPEAGTTYTVDTYDDATDVLLDTSSGITGTSYSPPIVGVYRLRVEVTSQRDGVDSWQAQVRRFDYSTVSGTVAGFLGYRTAAEAINGNMAMTNQVYEVGGEFHDTTTNNDRVTIPAGVTLARFAASYKPQTTIIEFSTKRNVNTNFPGQFAVLWDTNDVSFVYGTSAIVQVSSADYYTFVRSGLTQADSNGNWGSIEVIDSATRYALVGKTANQTIPTGTTTTLTWDTETADTSGWHDNSTNNSRLTVPSGVTRVRVSASVITTSFTGQAVLTMLKNGAGVAGALRQEVDDGGTRAKRANGVSAVLDVAPGDYFEVQFFVTNADEAVASESTWFCIEEVPDRTRVLLSKGSTEPTAANTPEILSWTSEVYDASGLHDNSTNNSRITVPSGVSYARVAFAVTNQSVAGWLRARTLKNGSPFIGMVYGDVDTAGAECVSGMTAWVPVAADDYFEIEVTTQNAAVIDNGNTTWFFAEFQ